MVTCTVYRCFNIASAGILHPDRAHDMADKKERRQQEQPNNDLHHDILYRLSPLLFPVLPFFI